MLPSNAETKAMTFSVVQVRSANVAPVTTMDSPSAIMTKPAQRSAMWPPSTLQSATDEAPYFGIQNRASGDKYSMPSATAHSPSREFPSAIPPAIQKAPDTESQTRMRMAFRRARPGTVEANRKIVRPICIAL